MLQVQTFDETLGRRSLTEWDYKLLYSILRAIGKTNKVGICGSHVPVSSSTYSRKTSMYV